MKIKMLASRALGILMAGLVLMGCSDSAEAGAPQVLGDLAYQDGASRESCVVLVPEGEQLVPYLVMTDQYQNQGSCLLVRKHLLEQRSIYNELKGLSAYYEGSTVDRFLEESFFSSLPQELQDNILWTGVEITSKDTLRGLEDQKTVILRKVFLLSAREVGDGDTSQIPGEGQPLPYFQDDESRAALYDDGTSGGWWLRTPMTWYTSLVTVVTPDGRVGYGGVAGIGTPAENRGGVRPGFCLSTDLPVSQDADGNYIVRLPMANPSES